MAGRLEDVGLDAKKLTFSEKDWNALEDVVDPLVPEAKGRVLNHRERAGRLSALMRERPAFVLSGSDFLRV